MVVFPRVHSLRQSPEEVKKNIWSLSKNKQGGRVVVVANCFVIELKSLHEKEYIFVTINIVKR